jgi:hypothetical protein
VKFNLKIPTKLEKFKKLEYKNRLGFKKKMINLRIKNLYKLKNLKIKKKLTKSKKLLAWSILKLFSRRR